jgi:hypothetical protein
MRRPMMMHTIGIDLVKTVFHQVGLNVHGEVVVQRKCSRVSYFTSLRTFECA